MTQKRENPAARKALLPAIARQQRTAARESFEARSQLRRTVCWEEMEDLGEGTAAKRVREGYEGWGRKHPWPEQTISRRAASPSCGAKAVLANRETVPHRRSGVSRIEQLENGEGGVMAVCDFSPGQQMWRVREGSGEAPACTAAAARGRMSLVGYLTIPAA